MLYLSAYFDEHREEYYRLLFRVSTEGAWKDWVHYFLRGVAEQANDAVERAQRLVRLRESMREKASTSQAGTNLVRLVDVLFESPAVNVPMIEKKLGCTHQTGLNLVERLIASGVLEEVSGRKRRRVYLAREILDVVS
jgi:Fic family protein